MKLIETTKEELSKRWKEAQHAKAIAEKEIEHCNKVIIDAENTMKALRTIEAYKGLDTIHSLTFSHNLTSKQKDKLISYINLIATHCLNSLNGNIDGTVCDWEGLESIKNEK